MAQTKDPNEIVHVHVKAGETVIHNGIAYGDRATLQVPRHVAAELKGQPDVGERRDVPSKGARK
jgi:hypothetical protein